MGKLRARFARGAHAAYEHPEAYLADILPRLARGISLADDLSSLMPHTWLEAHPDAAVPAMNVQRVSRYDAQE